MDYRFLTKGVTEIRQDGEYTIVRSSAAPQGVPQQPIAHTPSDGVYLVSPPGQEPFLQGGPFLEHGPVVRVNEQGFPVDASGRIAGANVSGETMTQLITSKILTYKGKSYTGYGYEIKGAAAMGNAVNEAPMQRYSVAPGGSFDLPFPRKADGTAKFALGVPLGRFTLTFQIPGDEQDSSNSGYIMVISKPAPDRFGAKIAVLDGAAVILAEQQYAGSWELNYRVGVDGGDGTPVLQRGRSYTIAVDNLIGDEWRIAVARPSRY